MNIAVIGASAGIGLETVKRALDRNHFVTSLSRTEMPLSKQPNLQIIYGNALDKAVFQKAIAGADAVIVTIGTRKGMEPTTLYSDFGKLLIKVQKETPTQVPYIIVTSHGVGESRPYVSWFVNVFIKYFLKYVVADKTVMEEMIAESDINYIFVRPGRLLDGPLTEKYKIIKELYKGVKIDGISRADVADYMVKQAESPSDMHRGVAITPV